MTMRLCEKSFRLLYLLDYVQNKQDTVYLPFSLHLAMAMARPNLGDILCSRDSHAPTVFPPVPLSLGRASERGKGERRVSLCFFPDLSVHCLLLCSLPAATATMDLMAYHPLDIT